MFYLIVGCAVGCYVLLTTMPSIDAFAPRYDNVFHLGLVRSYVRSGQWNILTGGIYLEPNWTTINPLPGDGFYPAAWHIVVALTMSLTGTSEAIAVNAANYLFSSLVFPLGMYALLSIVFKDKAEIIPYGAVCTCALVSFPWVLLNTWPLYPNHASMAVLPAYCCAFMLFLQRNQNMSSRILSLILFLFGTFTVAVLQPNTIFAALVILMPYTAWVVWDTFSAKPWRILILCIYVVLCFGFWFVLFKVPFLQDVINYFWAPTQSIVGAGLGVLTQSYIGALRQFVPALCVIIGIVIICLKKRSYLWIVAAYAFAASIFVVASSFDDSFIKHLLAGFWYTDPYRVAAIAVVAAIPLMTLGLASMSLKLQDLLQRFSGTAISIVVVVLFCLGTYYPSVTIGGHTLDSPFDNERNAARYFTSNSDSNPYEQEERDFVQKVLQQTTAEDVIINMPYDGSLFSYSIDGLPVYYRYLSGYGTKASETDASKLIRNSLDQIATNDEVRSAVNDLGAQYVLILEKDIDRTASYFPGYQQEQWSGLLNLDDSTPGFEIVLRDGDMRLYRITA